MQMEAFVCAVEERLETLADSDRGRQMTAYLLDQFEFLGLSAPVRRKAVRDLIRQKPADGSELVKTARLLWEKPQREYRYTAIDLLKQHNRLLKLEHLPAIRELLQRDSWWETVDGLSGVIGMILQSELNANVQRVMDEWVAHPDLWVRRAAMLHQLGWRLRTDEGRLEKYALVLGEEKEFFIRKAIGWALRDYARWNPQFVRLFISQNIRRLSSLTVREASKHL